MHHGLPCEPSALDASNGGFVAQRHRDGDRDGEGAGEDLVRQQPQCSCAVAEAAMSRATDKHVGIIATGWDGHVLEAGQSDVEGLSVADRRALEQDDADQRISEDGLD
jgi:hypothetical protein